MLKALMAAVRDTWPDARLVLAGENAGLLQRSGAADLAGSAGWHLEDLAREPAHVVASGSSMLPVRVPVLAWTDHVLITLATLAADPYIGFNGALSHQMALFAGLLDASLRIARHKAAALATQLWKPNLCILDARRVVLVEETKLTRSVSVTRPGVVWAGPTPEAVDARAAALLKLSSPKRRRARPTGDDAVQLGELTQEAHTPLISPYVYTRRAKTGVSLATAAVEASFDRALDRVDLPRIVDFVRRAKGGQP